MEKMWPGDASMEEREDVRKIEKRKRKLMKWIEMGYLTKLGEEYFKKELMKEINKTERKYRDGDSGKSV